MKVFIKFGLYLDRAALVLDYVDMDEITPEQLEAIAIKEAYPRAYEMAESWVGSQGFCDYEEDEEADEHEEIEEAIEYEAEIYDPEKHEGWAISSEGVEVIIMEGVL